MESTGHKLVFKEEQKAPEGKNGLMETHAGEPLVTWAAPTFINPGVQLQTSKTFWRCWDASRKDQQFV